MIIESTCSRASAARTMTPLALAFVGMLACGPHAATRADETVMPTNHDVAQLPSELLAVGGNLTSDGRFVLTSQKEGRIRIYDAATWALRHEITGRVRALSADGRVVVTTALADGSLVQAWSIEDATQLFERRIDPECTDIVASDAGMLCVRPRVPTWPWIAFSDGGETRLAAIDGAEIVAVSSRGRYLAASIEPRHGVTTIVVRERSTGDERRHALPSQRRHLWPEALPESDPVTIHEIVVGEAGEVACATGEARVHLWSPDGQAHVFDVAHAPLAFEPAGGAVWGLADTPKFGTLHRFGFDGSDTVASGGREPFGVFSSRSLIAFADDDVLVLHGGGVDRYSRSQGRWRAPAP